MNGANGQSPPIPKINIQGHTAFAATDYCLTRTNKKTCNRKEGASAQIRQSILLQWGAPVTNRLLHIVAPPLPSRWPVTNQAANALAAANFHNAVVGGRQSKSWSCHIER